MILFLRLLRQAARTFPFPFGRTAILSLLLAMIWICEPLYSRHAIDLLLSIREGAAVDLVRIFGIWGAIFAALCMVQGLEKYSVWELDNRMIFRRRETVYRHVLDLDIGFHTQQKSGEVIKILDEGADNYIDLQRQTFELLPSFLTAFTFLVIGAFIEVRLTLILLLAILLYLGIVVIGIRKTAALQQTVNRLWVTAIGRAYDAEGNIFAVQANTQEKRELEEMQRSHAEAFDAQQKVNRRWAMIEAMHFFMLTRVLLSGIGILFYVHDLISLGDVYFFQFSFYRVLAPFEMLGGMLPHWNKKMGKVSLSEEILNTPVRIQSKKNAVRPTELPGEIVFDAVCFSYEKVRVFESEEETDQTPEDLAEHVPELSESGMIVDHVEEEECRKPVPPPHDHVAAGREVLHDVSFRIAPGEHIALVGHSGAGKTTLASLLLRFYDVTRGRMLIDGTDVRDLDLSWWREQIGLVQQENMMFNDTLLENIRYSRPDATEAMVRGAAERAAAMAFIDVLPKGLHTVIGDRGIRLSGGQRQRVAIARAILKEPKIVILDEATSALDSKTEQAVQQGIRGLIQGRTAVIIAHRLSTVRSVDRIAVMDKGRLIAFAPHEELMQTCALYKEMVELQSHGLLAE